MSHVSMEPIENIRNLSRKINKNLLNELVTLYSKTTPQIVEDMKSHLENESFQDLGMIAHSLKSSSANLGLVTIAEHAKAIEMHILNNQVVNKNLLEKEIQSIIDAYDDSLSELNTVANGFSKEFLPMDI